MKRKIIIICLLLFSSFTITSQTTAAYLSNTSQPWGRNSNVLAFKEVFDADYTHYTYSSANIASIFVSTRKFIWLEGGNSDTQLMLDVINDNKALIENWVSNGGVLVISAATNSINSPYSVGFGITSTKSVNRSVVPSDVNHPFFKNATYTPILTSTYSGHSIAHNYLTGSGLTPILSSTNGQQVVLAEKSFGNGLVLFSGLTTPFFITQSSWTPKPQTPNLLYEMLVYGGTSASPSDTTPPTITLISPGVQTIEVGSAYTELNATATDDTDGDITNNIDIDITNVNTAVVGNYTVKYNVSDAAGNSADQVSRTVNVVDTTAPTARTQDITVQLNANGEVIITPEQIDNGSSDDSGNVTLSLDKTSFNCSDVGANTVTLTVTDSNNNSSTDTAMVTVLDVLPIDANADEFTLSSCVSITFSTTDLLANDEDPYGRSLKIDFVDQPSNGTIVDNGNGTYTFTPNSSTNQTFTTTYTVKPNDGTTVFSGNGHFYEFVSAPNINWNSAKAAAEARDYQGQQGYLVTITSQAENDFAFSKISAQGWIGASDAAVEGQWKWTGGPEEGQLFWTGLYNGSPAGNAYNAWGGNEPNNAGNEDYAHFRSDGKWNDYPASAGGIQGYVVEYGGNTGDCNTQTTATAEISFILNDTTEPSLTAVANTTENLDASCNFSIPDYTGLTTATDNCGTPSVTQSPTSGTVLSGYNTVQTITLTADDGNGNTNTTTFNVTVLDITAPTITLIGAASVTHEAYTTYTDAGVTYADSCSATLVTTDDIDTDIPATYTVTYTATDESGNETIATRTVIVQDTTPPTAIAQDITVQLDASGKASISTTDIDNGSSDDSGDVTLSLDKTNFSCDAIGNSNNSSANFNNGYANGFKTNSNANIPTGNSARTMTTWMKLDAIPNTWGSVIQQGNGDCVGKMFAIGIVSGKLGAWGGCKDWVSNLTVSSGEWVHVAITYDGNGTVSLYYNGQGQSHNIGSYNTTASKLFMGVETTNNGGSFRNSLDGKLDEVKIFNKELTATEVQAEMAGSNPASINLVSHYNFEEGTGTEVNDLVGNNHGTAFGFTSSDWSSDTPSAGQIINSVTLTATDASGNVSTATATVTVEDNIAPTITLEGDESITVLVGGVFTDPGATASDNCSASVAVTGSVNTNLAGSYTLSYKAVDGSDNESTTTVSRTVIVNGLPSASDDVATVTEGTLDNVISVMSNDSFGPDGPGNISIATPPTSGTATVSGSTLLYTPVANVTSDTLVYTVEDANGDLVFATLNITINRLPSGVADTATFDEDSSSNTIAVLDNDDVDLDGLGAVNIGTTSTQGGTLSVNTDNEVVYTPVVQFVGQDTFTYSITDGNGDTSSAITVTIDVIVVSPEPSDDAYDVNQNTSDTVLDVLANDSFGADGPKGFTITTTTTNGALVLDSKETADPTDDVVIYTPRATYNGPDSFTYTLEDSNGDSTTASVAITVRPIVPVPTDDMATVDKNSSNNEIAVLANDDFGGNEAHSGYPLTFNNGSKTSASDQGATLSIEDNNTPTDFTDDVIFYTPFPDFVGEDTFQYTITDADGDGAAASVTVTVVAGNNGNFTPTAVADMAAVFVGSEDNVLDVLDNDVPGIDGYIDGGLTMTNGTLISASAQAGVISIDNKGTAATQDDVFKYTPAANFTGEDTFSYTITDLTGDSSTAEVRVTVSIMAAAPSAIADTVTIDQDTTVSIAVLANDVYGTDNAATTDALTVGMTSASGGSTAVVNNEISYTPAQGFVGTDTFEYTITDGTADTATATVTITVSEVVLVNGEPTAVSDTATFGQNSVDNIITVTDNDAYGTDSENATHPLTLSNGSLVGVSVNGGAIRVSDNGTANDLTDDVILYSPATDFNGTDTFDYTITDGNGDAATGTVTITVTASSAVSVPTAVDDVVSINAGGSASSIAVLDNDNFGLNGAIDNGLTMPNGTSSSASVQGGTIRVETNNTVETLDDVIMYQPAKGFTGEDRFQYTITDASGDAATATVMVTVKMSNVPNAVADTAVVIQDTTDNEITVLANDSFGSDGVAASNSLTVTGSSAKAGTTSVLNNKVLYTPGASFVGEDTFSYTIEDGSGDTSTAMVRVSVEAAVVLNGTPSTTNDTATVAQNSTATSIDVTTNDSYGTDGENATHPLTLSNGSLEGVSTNGGSISVDNGTVLYSPATDFNGVDTFEYLITDGSGDAATGIVTVNVTASSVVSVPTAVDDSATINVGELSKVIEVLDNDDFGLNGAIDNGLTMPNGTASSGSAQGGTINVDDKGTDDTLDDVIVYTPEVGFTGVDTFSYTITDASGDASTAMVTISVMNNVPLAVDDVLEVAQNSGSTNIDVIANDSFGTHGKGATPFIINSPDHITGTTSNGGTFALEDKGTAVVSDDEVSYLPAANFVGSDSFDYTIRDANGNQSIGTVRVTVRPIVLANGTPTANDDAVTVDQNSVATSIAVTSNDTYGTDQENATHPLTLINGKTSTASDQGGAIRVGDNGTPNDLTDDVILYTPPTDYNGVDTFIYTITDGDGEASTATVTVTIVVPKGGATNEGSPERGALQNSFTTYPNPSNGYVKSTVFSTIETKATLLIFDVTGKVIYNVALEIQKGGNEFDFNLNVKPGVLFIKITSPAIDFGTSKILFK